MFETMELHTRLKVVNRGEKGRTCCGSAAYRAGENIRDTDGELHRYSKKEGVVDSWIMLPKEAPKEFADRETLWQYADMAEHKKNGEWRKNPQLYRDWNASMPNEFSYERAHCLLEELFQPLVDEGMIADISIHDPEPDPGKDRNLHAHVMLTLRGVSEEGFGKKNRHWNDINLAEDLRRNWAKLCNEELESMGLEPRVEWQTYAERGIPTLAQRHEGPGQRAWEKREGVDAEYINKNMRYNRSKLRIVKVKKESWPLLRSALDMLDAPYHRLTAKEEEARKINNEDGALVFIAAPSKELVRLIGEGADQELWNAVYKYHNKVRDRQRAIWQVYDKEKALATELRKGYEEKKLTADMAWMNYRVAKSDMQAAWKQYRKIPRDSYEVRNDVDRFINGQYTAKEEQQTYAMIASEDARYAYNRACALTGEANRGVKAARIIQNYRNFALGLAKDMEVPQAELDAATQAYEQCIKELEERNNNKTRYHLTRQLEEMQAKARKAARQRRRQQLVETLKRILFKKEQEEKNAAGRKMSLEDQMKGAAAKKPTQAQAAQQKGKEKVISK